MVGGGGMVDMRVEAVEAVEGPSQYAASPITRAG